MDSIKSIAVPVTRRAASKTKRAGRPAAPLDSSVGGQVGEYRRQPRTAAPRALHRYRAGQRLVMAQGGRDIARPSSGCIVTSLLPNEGGPLLYRVRSDTETFERVVDEIDLSPLR